MPLAKYAHSLLICLAIFNQIECHRNDDPGQDQDISVFKPSFFDEISKHRTGGIDVSRHSKERRKFSIIHSHEPTPSPREDTTSKSQKEKVQSESSGSKPKLKVGIVLPRQIFQQRRYQTIIRSSLNEIAQEKCLYSEEQEESSTNETRQKRRRWGRSTRSRGGLGIGIGINATTKQSIFRNTKNTLLMRKSPQRIRNHRTQHQSLLEHVREKFDFVWNSATFRLDDDLDSVNFGDLVVSPPPSDITDLLCQHLSNGSVAIIYFTNTEKFGRSTAASQYFLQMAGFLGIPVIAWNADNAGLESRSSSHLGSEMTGHLQLAPSVDHQVLAMLSIMDRYNWRQFGIVTSEIAGHDDFVQAVRDRVAKAAMSGRSRYNVQASFKISQSNNWDVMDLAASEVRIIVLHCTQGEASLILGAAEKAGLTSHKYLWLVTQSVIGDPTDRSINRRALPLGMLGIHFEVDMLKVLQPFVSLALRSFFHAVDTMLHKRKDNEAAKTGFNFSLNCQGIDSNHRWKDGPEFYRQLLDTTLTMKRMKNQEMKIFNKDGTVRETELKIMNFRPMGTNKNSDPDVLNKQWEEVGTWNSWNGLDIKDIVWPGGSHVPPQGVPEKFHIRITFLEEPPFIIISDPDPISKKCSMNRGVPCYMQEKTLNSNQTQTKCCSGLCIDLLTKFEDELGFTYDLVRVPDPKWGTFEHGSWNGLMWELVNKRTDLVLSALKINAERETVVDFTTPFLESGIAIVVAKRTGIISPTAFLEPFDKSSWMLIAFVAIQASAFSIFLFEWLSPSGYDMQVEPSKSGHRFSLFRTYWLVVAVLFQASVSVDCPRGLTARFMSSIWALFAVVFLALYTANLAAFMIPRKEYHNLAGLDDERIANPYSQKPSLKFATVPYSYTQVTLQKYFPEMFNYMRKYNEYNETAQAIKAVKDGQLDAFIYDGTVLNYLASQDEECRLLQVGTWSAMTGYALAFPHHSKYKSMFNEKILELRENGDLERLSRFWMSGTCKPNEQEKRASEPLSIAQFLSAFLLLLIGMAISVMLLFIEHFYMTFLQNHVTKKNENGCCALISQSIGKTILSDERNAEIEESRLQQCLDDCCKTKLFQLTSELEFAKEEIAFLEGLIKTSERDELNFRPYAFGPRQDDDDDDNLCPVEAARDEGESFNELEHILELESVPKDLMVLQRKRSVNSSSSADLEEKETVL